MVYKIAAVIFSIIIQTTIIDDASAQNMVLNSDFNKFCCCQKDFSQRFSLIDVRDSNFPIDFYANNWFYAIPSSPDYYNIECSDSFITEAYIKFYKHFFDSTLLIKESSYIGINFGPDGNFETITGQLCSTLVAGEN